MSRPSPERRDSESNDVSTWAMIAGGGTAGHALPGLAIAQALVAGGRPSSSIHFVGSATGVERDLIPEAGFGLTVLPGRGLQRRLTAENLGAGWGIARAFGRALRLVRRRRPSVVVAMGGYASVPCAAAAILLRVPVVVHEQNAVPGLANRLVARFARAAAVSFEGTALPRATVTGNPVRSEMLAIDRERDRADARKRLELPEGRRVVAVFGGSLGARRINEAVLGALGPWAERRDLAVRHVIGRRDWDMASESIRRRSPESDLIYQPVEFESRMDLLLAGADVVVCRAGATSVAELTIVGVPSVLIPLPGAPGDHQTANARHLERGDAAVVLRDSELDAARLVDVLDELLGDPSRLAAMGVAARRLGRRDAADRVAAMVEKHAQPGWGP